jgi:sugar/nucleoside kinase (ribokinase family)
MDVLCLGEMLADIISYPAPEVTYNNGCSIINSITVQPGGDAFNNAMDLTTLGHSVAYVGRIGNDAIGSYLLEAGINAGINMEHVVVSKNPHGKMDILVNQNGDRAFLYYPGTSAEFCFEDIDLELLKQVKIVQIGSTFHLPKFDGEGTSLLLKCAKEYGCLTTMDVTTDFSGRWNEVIEPAYPNLDYFFPSIEQAEKIAGTSDPHLISQFLLKRGVKHVCIKLGSKGCYYEDPTIRFFCSCYQVRVVETTGAGDAFVSGFISSLLHGRGAEDCVRFATACSAFAIQSIGATAGLRDYGSVQNFISESQPLIISYI